MSSINLIISMLVFAVEPSSAIGASPLTQVGRADAGPVRTLEPNKPIGRELAGGETHYYEIVLTSDQYLSAVVEQQGIDVVVKVIGPDGRQFAEVDSPNGAQGPEPVFLLTETAGRYQVNVQSLEKDAARGRYEIRIKELRSATADDRALQEARNLSRESDRLNRERNYDAALPLAERSLALRERVLGVENLEITQDLYALMLIHYAKANYAKAKTLVERVLAIREKLLPPDHPDVAAVLSDLAVLHHLMQDNAKAEQFYQRAVTILEKRFGRDYLALGVPLNGLAGIYLEKEDYARAIPLFERVLALREKGRGPEHIEVADSLHRLAELYRNLGEYDKAIALAERALAIRVKASGPEHPENTLILYNLSSFYQAKGDYAKATKLAELALAINEKAYGPVHPNTALSLGGLASLYRDKGDYDRALPLAERALAIEEKVFGPEHPRVATALHGLALIYKEKVNDAKAEQLQLRALAIYEKKLGPEHPGVATTLIDLAWLYFSRGDSAKATSLGERALAIQEKALGPEHPDVANSLHLLARANSDHVKIERFLLRALAIYEKKLGPEHPRFAGTLGELALFYQYKGEYDKEEALLFRSLNILEKKFGPEHPTSVRILHTLAFYYLLKGDYEKAGPLYQQVITSAEKVLGAEHQFTGGALISLALLYAVRGDQERAVEALSRGLTVRERNIAVGLATGSERQKLLYLRNLAMETSATISLHVNLAPDNRAACRQALTTILRRKGRALDAMTDTVGALRRRFSPQDRELLDQLTETRAQLATLALAGPGKIGVAVYRSKIKQLETQGEKLEAEVSLRSLEFRIQSAPVTLEAVQATIPRDAALVEFVLYNPINLRPKQGEKLYGAQRYVAYVLERNGDPRWIEIGKAKEIDETVKAFRVAVRDPRSKAVKPLARRVDQLVMQPVRKLLRDRRRVLLSPEGALNLIPFAALVDEQNRYLVERYSFSYLTSGRDLLRLATHSQPRGGAVVIANPDFGDQTAIASDRGLKVKQATADSSPTTANSGVDLSAAFFSPLPSTAEEGQALMGLMPDAVLLTGGRATEAALKQVAKPSILHIATHGFFLDSMVVTNTSEERGLLVTDSDSEATAIRVENPLLRSGLGLAGANLRSSGGEDGILTALEAAGLDLSGTKLVVLSACDTGVGEVRNGEGVYGLRRALVLAGSESQVMSLWPVSDQGTRDLMIGYYKRLIGAQGRAEALRNIQLSMLASKGRSHPYYWASFIQSGEWANLAGQR
jgi:CHAT domain-containing protein/Tfp pilus assembly protein PilF